MQELLNRYTYISDHCGIIILHNNSVLINKLFYLTL